MINESTPTNQPTREDNLQNFNPITQGTTVYVSQQLKKEMKDNGSKCVHKYLLLDYFIDSIINHYFYMAAPSKWEDPFEVKYLEFLNNPQMMALQSKDIKELKSMSIFCSCMTYNESDSEEASWKSYGLDKEQLIRVSYDLKKMCNILTSKTDEVIYIGKLNYRKRKEIVNPTVISERKGTKTESLEVLYVNNFCLKQEAYQYEKELRFCRILKGEQFKHLDELKINDIDLSSAIKKITLPPINYNKMNAYEAKTKFFQQIKNYFLLKALCPKIPIYVSNLYDSSKVEMISEFKINSI